jgi:tetratricopeptide (TPR) repeat protein
VHRATEKDFERNYHLDLIKDELVKMVSKDDLYKQYRFKMNTPENWKGFYDNYDQEKQDLEAHISASDKAITEDPSNAQAWYTRGVALSCLGKDEDALESLDKAIDLASNRITLSEAIRVRCEILEELGRHAEAEGGELLYYLILTERDPTNPKNFADTGKFFGSKHRYQAAIESYDEAIKLDPANSELWADKGEALHEMGKFKKAIRCFDKAIELGPSHPRPFEGKGKALKALGRDEDADSCFQKALKLKNKTVEEC